VLAGITALLDVQAQGQQHAQGDDSGDGEVHRQVMAAEHGPCLVHLGGLDREERAAGHSQARLASLVGYSRSTIANVETGRQRVPRDFWEGADAACRTGGVLTQASDEVEAAARREREDSARQARPSLLALPGSPGTGSGQLTRVAGGALEMPGHGDGWRDVIAVTASQARGHAEQAAVTEHAEFRTFLANAIGHSSPKV